MARHMAREIYFCQTLTTQQTRCIDQCWSNVEPASQQTRGIDSMLV